MFTVKHISPTGGESLYEAVEVSFGPARAEPGLPALPDIVWYTDPRTREIKSLEQGFVYVTNDTGATVAKYNLAGQQAPGIT